MTASKLAGAFLTACLLAFPIDDVDAQERAAHALETPLPGPTSAAVPAPAASPIDRLNEAFFKADRTVDYANVDGPRSWYREHITTIQHSTPLIGCWVGGALASRAGSGALLGLATCAAGSVGFSSIGVLINPIKEDVEPSPELDSLFSSLPKRDATSAINLLSGSLDADGRASRQQTLAKETKSRGAEIAAIKERKQQNGSIWGQILLGAAQGYLAYEANKGRIAAASAMPSIGGGSSTPSTTIYRRDANGQSQGQYQAPLAKIAPSSSPATHGDGSYPAGPHCADYARNAVRENVYYFSVTNICNYSIHVRLRDDRHGVIEFDLKPGKKYTDQVPTDTRFLIASCPDITDRETGRSVVINGQGVKYSKLGRDQCVLL